MRKAFLITFALSLVVVFAVSTYAFKGGHYPIGICHWTGSFNGPDGAQKGIFIITDVEGWLNGHRYHDHKGAFDCASYDPENPALWIQGDPEVPCDVQVIVDGNKCYSSTGGPY